MQYRQKKFVKDIIVRSGLGRSRSVLGPWSGQCGNVLRLTFQSYIVSKLCIVNKTINNWLSKIRVQFTEIVTEFGHILSNTSTSTSDTYVKEKD